MKLKQVIKLLFIATFALAVTSCNSDSSETIVLNPSADAQIYSFKLSAIASNAIDSANYPVLATTMFAIDQDRLLIYNPDSLPYQTRLKKYFATIAFSSMGNPSNLELLYRDSTATWNSTDSIDFTEPMYPRLKVTAENGSSTREYTVDIRIHQVDPDTLVWKRSELTLEASIATQKTIMGEDHIFYTLSKDSDGKLYLRTASTTATSFSSRQAVSVLPAVNIMLESFTYLESTNKYYILDESNNAYISDDAINWAQKNNITYSIIGVLPSLKSENDSLLIVANKDGVRYFATTNNMENIVFRTAVPSGFPISGFSSATNFDRSNINMNILSITGGRNSSNQYLNLTWSFQTSNTGELRLIPNQSHSTFLAKAGISTFIYDDYLYALTDNKLYKSASFGSRWIPTPNKEILDSRIPEASAQSVVVDKDNYIWIFGGNPASGNSTITAIWKGRLNKLNTK